MNCLLIINSLFHKKITPQQTQQQQQPQEQKQQPQLQHPPQAPQEAATLTIGEKSFDAFLHSP